MVVSVWLHVGLVVAVGSAISYYTREHEVESAIPQPPPGAGGGHYVMASVGTGWALHTGGKIMPKSAVFFGRDPNGVLEVCVCV